MNTQDINTAHAELVEAVSPRLIAMLAHFKRALQADGWSCLAEEQTSSADDASAINTWSSWSFPFFASSAPDTTLSLHVGFVSDCNRSGALEHNFAVLIETADEENLYHEGIFDITEKCTPADLRVILADTPIWVSYAQSAYEQVSDFLVL